MSELLSQLIGQFAAQSWLEFIAVVLALAYVWLAARQNILCWPCALISTGIYVWLFWEVSLPFHTVLNIYYLIMAVYGWNKWRGGAQDAMVTQRWTLKTHVIWASALTLTGFLLVYLVDGQLDPAYLYLDAFITVFSVFTTVLVAHKVLENWLYWIVINSFAAYLYFSKDLVLTGVLFVIYVAFAIYGYISWRKQDLGGKENLSYISNA